MNGYLLLFLLLLFFSFASVAVIMRILKNRVRRELEKIDREIEMLKKHSRALEKKEMEEKTNA